MSEALSKPDDATNAVSKFPEAPVIDAFRLLETLTKAVFTLAETLTKAVFR